MHSADSWLVLPWHGLGSGRPKRDDGILNCAVPLLVLGLLVAVLLRTANRIVLEQVVQVS